MINTWVSAACHNPKCSLIAKNQTRGCWRVVSLDDWAPIWCAGDLGQLWAQVRRRDKVRRPRSLSSWSRGGRGCLNTYLKTDGGSRSGNGRGRRKGTSDVMWGSDVTWGNVCKQESKFSGFIIFGQSHIVECIKIDVFEVGITMSHQQRSFLGNNA